MNFPQCTTPFITFHDDPTHYNKSANQPANNLYLSFGCTLLIRCISNLLWYETSLEIGNTNDGNISCISCLFPLIRWYSMEKCINLNAKFLTSVTFCDGDGIRIAFAVQQETKNRLKQIKKFVIQKMISLQLLFRYPIQHK